MCRDTLNRRSSLARANEFADNGYNYDTNNTTTGESNSENGTTTYTYDNARSRHFQSGLDRCIVAYNYDNLNRVIQNTKERSIIVRYGYDFTSPLYVKKKIELSSPTIITTTVS